MLKLREEFSKLFTEWFSVLVPETITARLAEDFTPIIEQQGYELNYAYLSGGERTAVALSYRLALNQVINFSDIALGKFTYVPDDGTTTQVIDTFNFEIADAGSGTFVG